MERNQGNLGNKKHDVILSETRAQTDSKTLWQPLVTSVHSWVSKIKLFLLYYWMLWIFVETVSKLQASGWAFVDWHLRRLKAMDRAGYRALSPLIGLSTPCLHMWCSVGSMLAERRQQLQSSVLTQDAFRPNIECRSLAFWQIHNHWC